MAEVKFNIKINIDGKEKVVGVTTDVKRLGEELGTARTRADRFRQDLIKWNQATTAIQTVSQSINQVTAALADLTRANATQVEAETKLATNMRNTMDATDGEVEAIKRLCAAQQELGVIGDEVQLAGAQGETYQLSVVSHNTIKGMLGREFSICLINFPLGI